jgi:hypothetical protein
LDLGMAQVVEHLPSKHEAPSSKLKQYEKRFLKYCDRSQVPGSRFLQSLGRVCV